jgi:TetR/AcrR family transcriptional regulator, transcriptional repressor for nem operon
LRYAKDHKQATRERILEAAGRRFKKDGIDGAGVAAVMSDAGLTNGAFYAHFKSKEDLVANVLADQLHAQCQNLSALPPGKPGLEMLVRLYLSPEHRKQYADGCPSAALLDEVVRRPRATKKVFTGEAIGIVDEIATRLDRADVEVARHDALALYGLLIGTLQLARALTDRELSDEALSAGVDAALELIG